MMLVQFDLFVTIACVGWSNIQSCVSCFDGMLIFLWNFERMMRSFVIAYTMFGGGSHARLYFIKNKGKETLPWSMRDID